MREVFRHKNYILRKRPLKLEIEKKTVILTEEKISILGAQTIEVYEFLGGFALLNGSA